ncbi:efflux RND transporter periplasmic adaptor subunit [Heyndrickxia vini]|uniref:Efflux RND transporter periplasmic adaptor subunit n=1 Tax=Heyndrickxia vini TaxID=1476025 RepID=A0ABX7E0A4_9BACI|nr:efflux RND transporter periplasmic adaptor subunit [Heyndrickxia vini]QQZ08624.1 efflux RND transporter periplasmic adaptor subunit [Heyndrickxia vini]
MKKWIITIIIAVIVIGGASWYFLQNKKNQQPVMAATSTATVQKGKLDVKVSGSGSISSSSSQDVKATEMDEIDEVLVSKNDTVTKGDELITFTDGSDPIVAPITGTITSLDVASGDKTSDGQVIAHITNYKKLETTIKIDELDISDIKVGQSAEITASAFPDETFKGKVTNVAKEGEATNGVSTFDVTVNINEPKKLKVGMSTEANILTASKGNALYIPVEAVHSNGDKKYVVIPQTDNQDQEHSSSSRVEIKTGIHNDTYIEVTNGLSKGQQVELPAIVKSSSTTNEKMRGMGEGGMMNGNFPGMNQNGGTGPMNRNNGNGGGRP